MTMTSMLLLFVFTLMVGESLGFDHSDWHFITTSYQGEKVNGVLGINRRNMLMIPDPVEDPSKCNRRTINQHDFQKRLVAIKDPVKRECLVKPTGRKETYEYTKRALDNGEEFVQSMEKNWDVPKNPLAKDQVKRTIGAFLDDFCSGSDVLMLKSLKRAKKLTKRGSCFFCLWCQNS